MLSTRDPFPRAAARSSAVFALLSAISVWLSGASDLRLDPSESLAALGGNDPRQWRGAAYVLALLSLVAIGVVMRKVGVASALRCRMDRVALVLLIPALLLLLLRLFP